MFTCHWGWPTITHKFSAGFKTRGNWGLIQQPGWLVSSPCPPSFLSPEVTWGWSHSLFSFHCPPLLLSVFSNSLLLLLYSWGSSSIFSQHHMEAASNLPSWTLKYKNPDRDRQKILTSEWSWLRNVDRTMEKEHSGFMVSKIGPDEAKMREEWSFKVCCLDFSNPHDWRNCPSLCLAPQCGQAQRDNPTPCWSNLSLQHDFGEAVISCRRIQGLYPGGSPCPQGPMAALSPQELRNTQSVRYIRNSFYSGDL